MIRWLQSLFGSPADSEPVTLESLQGKWKMVGVGKMADLRRRRLLPMRRYTMTIQGDKYTVTNDGEIGDQGIIKLDTKQTPVHFDQHFKTWR